MGYIFVCTLSLNVINEQIPAPARLLARTPAFKLKKHDVLNQKHIVILAILFGVFMNCGSMCVPATVVARGL
jgi:hypothetical protein